MSIESTLILSKMEMLAEHKETPSVGIFCSYMRRVFDKYMMLIRGTSGKTVNLSQQAVAAARMQTAICRRTWNHFLALNITKYQTEQKFIFYHEMAGILTKLRQSKHDNFHLASCAAQQQTLKALDLALRSCFKTKSSRKGFPRFKKAAQNNSLRVPAVGVKTLRNEHGEITHVGFPKMPLMRVRGLEAPKGTRLISFALAQTAFGWKVSANYEMDKPESTPASEEVVGIDLGLTHFATLSTGEKIDNPRFVRKMRKAMRTQQRSLSRKRKGSVNRRRQAKRVARLHGRIANQRNNFLHHQTNKLVNQFNNIVIEDLCVKGLMRTRMAASVADVGWGEFRRQLTYKSQWNSRTLFVYPRFERSTGVCPACGIVGEKLPLNVREWTCDCGETHDRDIAAAQILALQGPKVGKVSPEPEISSQKSPKRVVARRVNQEAEYAERLIKGSPTNVPVDVYASTG